MLKADVLALLERLQSSGRRVYIPRSDYNYAVDVGVRMLTMRGALIETDGMLTANPSEMQLLTYYANSIAHLLNDDKHDGATPASAELMESEFESP